MFETVDKLMARLKYREEHRENVLVDKVVDLNIHWEDMGPSRSRSGYYAKIDGKELRLTDAALQTGCSLLKTKPRFYSQFPDKNKFPRDLRDALDSKQKGMLVRTNGIEITALLPQSYQVRDAHTLLDTFFDTLQENVGDFKGVESVEQGNGDICSYRVVMDANIMPSLNEKHGQYLGFFVSTSESGLYSTRTSLVLYRTICDNSAVEEESSFWDHRGDFQRFYDDTATKIQSAGYRQDRYRQIFEQVLRTPLGVPAADVLSALRQEKLISKPHFDAAKIQVAIPTEDGREVETQYDLYNVLTRAARDCPTIQSREQAEQTALRLFTAPGGIREQLREAYEARTSGVN